jgi:hypothetical protein
VSLKLWLENDRLKKHKLTSREIAELLAVADRALKDCQIPELSNEFQGHHTTQPYYKSGIITPEYHHSGMESTSGAYCGEWGRGMANLTSISVGIAGYSRLPSLSLEGGDS